MGMWIGRGRKARIAYGFDDIALVPGTVTVNSNEVDVSWELCGRRIELPIVAAAMDGVADPNFAVEMGRLGGLAVLNLDGVQARYEDPQEAIAQIVQGDVEATTEIVQRLYKEPIKEKLVAKRVEEIKKAKVPCAVSTIPQNAARFRAIAQEAGADIFVVQSTVTTARHIATTYKALDFSTFVKSMKIPVIAGNVVTYEQSVELMETGIAALLVGVGPGAACTTRGVLGVGVPQVTATVDCGSGRDFYLKKSGRYVPIITDGACATAATSARHSPAARMP